MHFRCPHCDNLVEVVPDASLSDVRCPSCGSQITLLDDTLTLERGKPRRVAHFELLRHVGSGHFGEVWQAHDTRLDRQVAIKLPRSRDLNASSLELFMREARAAAQVHHPNIVTIHEIGTADDTLYIASEFIHGLTLADQIQVRRFAPREAAEICATAADALHHAHEAGVVHRDLKPSNIMIDADGRPHLMDFGLAKREVGEVTITVAGRILGTPAYMPPEQARGEGHRADRRSDVYSLGVILYELLCGQRPFRGGSRLLLHQVLSDEPQPLRKVDPCIPRDLETICQKAMAKSPDRRYATAAEFGDDLRRYLRGESIHARRAPVTQKAWRWAKRNPAQATAAALGVMVVGLATGLLWPSPGPLMRQVTLATTPSGASVVFVPLDPEDGRPRIEAAIRPEEPGPVEVRLQPGTYLVVASLPDGAFHEVYRKVPEPTEDTWINEHPHEKWKMQGEVVELSAINLSPTNGPGVMKRFPGSDRFAMGLPRFDLAPRHERSLPPFDLETKEVTIGRYREVMGDLPRRLRPNAIGAVPLPTDSHPVIFVSWDEAVAYAERVGARLPDEAEYEFAATLGGTRAFPWGTKFAPMREWIFYGEARNFDRLPTKPPVTGLFSGPAEWTSSWASYYPGADGMSHKNPLAAIERVVRGGPSSVVEGRPDRSQWTLGPRNRTFIPRPAAAPGLGFRCARSTKARTRPEDYGAVLPAH